MNFDFSSLLPILAIVVSFGAAAFWDGVNGKGAKIENFFSNSPLLSKRLSCQPASNKIARIEILPGDRLKASDLKARDEQKAATPINS